jgi:hypothetical protein
MVSLAELPAREWHDSGASAPSLASRAGLRPGE